VAAVGVAVGDAALVGLTASVGVDVAVDGRGSYPTAVAVGVAVGCRVSTAATVAVAVEVSLAGCVGDRVGVRVGGPASTSGSTVADAVGAGVVSRTRCAEPAMRETPHAAPPHANRARAAAAPQTHLGIFRRTALLGGEATGGPTAACVGRSAARIALASANR